MEGLLPVCYDFYQGLVNVMSSFGSDMSVCIMVANKLRHFSCWAYVADDMSQGVSYYCLVSVLLTC